MARKVYPPITWKEPTPVVEKPVELDRSVDVVGVIHEDEPLVIWRSRELLRKAQEGLRAAAPREHIAALVGNYQVGFDGRITVMIEDLVFGANEDASPVHTAFTWRDWTRLTEKIPAGRICVGLLHSHPALSVQPSHIDLHTLRTMLIQKFKLMVISNPLATPTEMSIHVGKDCLDLYGFLVFVDKADAGERRGESGSEPSKPRPEPPSAPPSKGMSPFGALRGLQNALLGRKPKGPRAAAKEAASPEDGKPEPHRTCALMFALIAAYLLLQSVARF